jgi:hypothetical protein
MCRFDVAEELQVETPYRQVRADWQPYRADLEGFSSDEVDRDHLFRILRAYFDSRGLDTDWEALETTDDENLVNSLVMSCPFEASEKQILLEAANVRERNRLMTSLMEMATLDSLDDSRGRPI